MLSRHINFSVVGIALTSLVLIYGFQNCSGNSMHAFSAMAGGTDTAASQATAPAASIDLFGTMPQNLGAVNTPSNTVVRSNTEVTLPVSPSSLGFGLTAEDINRLSASSFTNTGSGVLCKLYARREVALNESISLKLVAYNWTGSFATAPVLNESDAFHYNFSNPMFDIAGSATFLGSNPDGKVVIQPASTWLLLKGNYIGNYAADSSPGIYTRSVEIKNSKGDVVCRTNTVSIKLLAASEAKSKPSSTSSSPCQSTDVTTVPYYTQWPAEKSLCTGTRILSFNDKGEITSLGVQAIYDFMDQDISQLGFASQGILTNQQMVDGVMTLKYCHSGRALVSGVKLYTNSGMPNDNSSYFDKRLNRDVSVKAYSTNLECID